MDAEIIPCNRTRAGGIGLCQMDSVALFNSEEDADPLKQPLFAPFKVNQVIESGCSYSSLSSRLGWFVATKTTTFYCCRDVHELPLEHKIAAFYCLNNSNGIVGNVVAAHFLIYTDFF